METAMMGLYIYTYILVRVGFGIRTYIGVM